MFCTILAEIANVHDESKLAEVNEQSMSGVKYLGACSQEIGSVVNQKGLVKPKSCAFCLCWVGLVPQAPADGCCGVVVPKLGVWGLSSGGGGIVLGEGFIKCLDEEEKEDMGHVISLFDTDHVVN